MNTTKIICTVIYIIFIVATFFSIGNVSQFFDINSFIFVIVVGGLYAFLSRVRIPIYKNLEMVLLEQVGLVH